MEGTRVWCGSLEIGCGELLHAPDAWVDQKAGWTGKTRDIPALLLVQLVTHTLAKLPELAPGLGVVGVDDEILEMP
jgi:hypothetical protein